MELRFYHDSFRTEYRSTFGAVAAGAALTLRLDVMGAPEGLGLQVYLRLWQDQQEQLLPMTPEPQPSPIDPATGMPRVLDYARYAVQLTAPEKGCLLWYYFVVTSPEGARYYYGNNPGQLGGEGQQYDHEPPSYQVTVYDKDSVTPDWFKHAVVYQIFPDRFCHAESETARYDGKTAAVLHSCWDDKPYYCKNPQGGIEQYDFFGGNLAGIRSKLGYLKELGVSCLYLNPVFKARSNHRYDTGNYKEIDPFLGNNAEFAQLCADARALGMRVVLDGVFSHTGDDSLYFNRFGSYRSVGAYQSQESPYYSWYKFKKYPDSYSCWWGVDTLPEVEETNPSYMDYIINDEHSVLRYWLSLGISGWRLDVADELPPKFLKRFYTVLKETNPDALLIGEVWEDASNKVSYGETREYLCGGQLDGVMNYVLRGIMLDFVLGRASAEEVSQRYLHMLENYPAQNLYAMLNLLGSHDVERVLTLLQESPAEPDTLPAYEQLAWNKQANIWMDHLVADATNWGTPVTSIVREVEQTSRIRQLAEDRLNLLQTWLMTLPGAPCIYYGDEAGVEGGKDPDNRRTFPWRHIDTDIHDWVRAHIKLRNEHAALRTGRYIPLHAEGDVLAYARAIEGGKDVFGAPAQDELFVVVLNRSSEATREVRMDTAGLCTGTLHDVIHDCAVPTVSGVWTVTLPPLGVLVLTPVARQRQRRAGVLLHPTSLPHPSGLGDLGPAAYAFVDFLQAAGQRLWQVLPLTPPGQGNSPYASPSAFAGSERLIALEPLVEQGLLSQQDVDGFVAQCHALPVRDQQLVGDKKLALLKQLVHSRRFVETQIDGNPAYAEFTRAQAYWLPDYALFCAIRAYFGGKAWYEWPVDIRRRRPEALQQYAEKLPDDVRTYERLQFLFFTQWQRLKQYAHERGVRILGDMPIFVAHDSADVWAHQALYQLDEAGMPDKVSGVPPDYFSAKGQLWGNPLYDWDALRREDYRWWLERLRTLGSLVDAVRIDHFRGFAACWAVPHGAEDATKGAWQPSPGAELFARVRAALPDLELVAEDLGVITPDVVALRDGLDLPGMRILQFHCASRRGAGYAFDTVPNCVAYSGTHDNSTLRGWYEEDLTPQQRQQARSLVAADVEVTSEALVRQLVAYLYARQAETVITPVQDLLALGNGSRMNLPGTATGNWGFQLTPAQAAALWQQAPWLRELAAETGR